MGGLAKLSQDCCARSVGLSIDLRVCVQCVHSLEWLFLGNESLLNQGLSQECQLACVCALSKFKDICTQIKMGEVTINDLRKMNASKELVESLCKAVEDKELTYSSLSACLDQRVQEFQFFEKRRQAYQDICNWIREPTKVRGMLFSVNGVSLLLFPLLGMTTLVDELKQDVSDKRICELCQFKDGAPVLLCCQAAKPLEPFADHFHNMMKKSSNLFLRPLEKRLTRTVASRSDLTIAHIYPEIWQPVFDECRKLLDSLINQSITLSHIDTRLKEYSDNLETVVFNLAVGLSKCLLLEPDHSQLRRALWKINQYWKLCEYRTGAQVFLQLRNVLKLKGDFGLVENFSSQVTQQQVMVAVL